MGILDLFKRKNVPKKESEEDIRQYMYENNIMGYRDKQDRRDYQDALLSKVNDAAAQYKQDKDLSAVIAVFEDAFIHADPPCHSSQNLDLVKFYVKAGQNDKAWGYLNLLLVTQEAPVDKIRIAQANILKKENRHIEAIKMYLMGHRAKYAFNKNVFIKDIKPSANKLGLNDMQIEYLVFMIEESASETSMLNVYYQILEEWGII